jgi:hypothetical protein
MHLQKRCSPGNERQTAQHYRFAEGAEDLNNSARNRRKVTDYHTDHNTRLYQWAAARLLLIGFLQAEWGRWIGGADAGKIYRVVASETIIMSIWTLIKRLYGLPINKEIYRVALELDI